MENKEKPNYYGILIADVRYDKRLSSSEKVLYAELTSLTNKEGFCWASNQYFADLYEVSKFTVSRWVSNLEKHGHIQVEVLQSDTTDRKIWLNSKNGVLTKSARGIDEKRKTYRQKAQHNIIINNKDNINTLSEDKSPDKTTQSVRKDQHIVNVIEKFILVSPTAATKYGVPTWRRAAEDLIKFTGGEEQAKNFVDEFVKARESNMLYLPVIDSLVQMASKFASIRQVMNKEKVKNSNTYNPKGSGYKYQDPLIAKLDNNK